jgi:uncharacterized membrane protein (DUF373 family)
MERKRVITELAAHYLSRAESVVLALVAVVLVVLAVMILGSSVVTLINSFFSGVIRDQAIDILDSVLLVMMMMEIVFTVTVSLQGHTLVAEPFLVIGAIAAIRRMLVITAESTKFEATNPEAFRSLLTELGLLGLIVVAMSVSVYVLRRSQGLGRVVKEDAVE